MNRKIIDIQEKIKRAKLSPTPVPTPVPKPTPVPTPAPTPAPKPKPAPAPKPSNVSALERKYPYWGRTQRSSFSGHEGVAKDELIVLVCFVVDRCYTRVIQHQFLGFRGVDFDFPHPHHPL